MSASRYPNKSSNIIPITIIPIIPNIQKPSRTLNNLSTAFLLPLSGERLCICQRSEVMTKSRQALPASPKCSWSFN